jgi:hypothetical protein
MTKIRRTWAVVLALLMAATIPLALTGCKEPGDHPSGDHPAKQVAPETPPAPEHPAGQKAPADHPSGEHPK